MIALGHGSRPRLDLEWWPWSLLGLFAVMPAPAFGQVVDSTLWSFSPGDRVLAIAPAGDTIYLAGSFLYVGPPSGGGVPVDAHSAQVIHAYARVVGEVDAVAADGAGGWFIGGRFSYVAGVPRSNLAHIAADGWVSAWAPNPDDRVWALALERDTLYVGGDFHSIGGAARSCLAAVSTASGTSMPWLCDADGRVSSLLLDRETLYVGGWFSTLGGQPRAYVGAVDAGTGTPTPWQVALDGRVRAFALADTTLFIGGYFTAANGDPHVCLAAVGAQSGTVHPWDAQLARIPISSIDFGPHVSALLVHANSLFVAGSFTSLGGQPRPGLAELDIASAQATSWHVSAHYPRALGPEFWALGSSGDTLFVAGEYDSLAGVPAANVSALSLSTAERLGWDPRTNDYVFDLALQGDVVFLGGWFTSVGEWVERRGLAAIDTRTGRATEWNPHPDNYVKCILAWGGKIYVGGYFSSVGGQPRSLIAALDPVSGQATAWNPGANGSVWALQPGRDGLLVGGLFTSIAGRPQRNLAVIDTATGLATAWNPSAFGDVYALAVTDSAIYVGGDFTSFGGQPRASVAAVDPLTGAATPWNPGTDGTVAALTLHDGIIYVGGFFHQVGGAPRDFLAAVDAAGSVTPWAPNPDNEVEALAAADSTIFVGGFFSGASGVSSEYFAALSSRTGEPDPSYPTPKGPVWSLAERNGTVYVGGGFGQIGRWPQGSFAAIHSKQMPAQPRAPAFGLDQNAPNPTQGNTRIRFSLAHASPVTLEVYDVQGRRVAMLLDHVLEGPGPHDMHLTGIPWKPGIYHYRLVVGGRSATRKMIVLQ